MRDSRRRRPQAFRSFFDNKEVPSDATVPELINAFNDFIEYFDFFNKSLSLSANFDGYIAEVSIPATSNLKIQHFLGVKPKYRIILRQTGNGVISDIDTSSDDWNDKIITLRNNGSVTVTVTVMIVRE